MKDKGNVWWSLAVCGGVLWLLSRCGPDVWLLVSLGVVFVVLGGRGLIAAGLGVGVGLFLLPLGLLAAFVGFSLIQILAELRGRRRGVSRDRFRNSHRTALKILEDGVT